MAEGISEAVWAGAMTERQFLEAEIRRWKASKTRKSQITGEEYYRGKHDILARKRTVIGRDGKLAEVENLPNSKIVDNQYGKMVDQKTNYLLGKPFNIQTSNEAYASALQRVFNRKFHRLFQNLGESSINCGIGWLYVYYGEDGEFKFKRFEPFEILPFWRDAEHTALDCVVRVYETLAYEGLTPKTVEKVEIYKANGIERYALLNGSLADGGPPSAYISAQSEDGGSEAYNWGRIPVVPFKCNDEETPLICKVKSLQDSINDMLSDFKNNMQEDSRNTILILKNYDGENLAEFRHNLASFGAVKVKTIDGSEGGVDALQIEVNADNYKAILELFKKALIENAMGFDAKDDRLSGNPNQMNILSMYSDIDLDANGMETEYQASMEDLLFFVNAHLANTGQGDFGGEEVEIVFNRDVMMNESDAIANVRNSVGILSTETLVAHHPWVDGLGDELERLGAERREAVDGYGDAFGSGDEFESQADD
jgi:SPP1 family phage portal protein